MYIGIITCVGAFVEPKIFTRRHVDFWTKEDKNTLEAYRVSYTRAVENHFFNQVKSAQNRYQLKT
ncbi:unnamed protein product [Malus baccata var. baccata]